MKSSARELMLRRSTTRAKKLAHVARAEAAKANSPMAGLVR